MPHSFTDSELDAYLDESLPAGRMTEIESTLRDSPELCDQVAAINARRDSGVHSLGQIWRRHRLTCPSREQLGSYLLGVLPAATAAYISFHLEEVGCRCCAASATDLKTQQAEADEQVTARRRKYFQSSAGHLPREI